MKTVLWCAGLLVLACPSVDAKTLVRQAREAARKSATVLSPVYDVDKKYRSMEGPESTQQLTLGDPEDPKLLWIEGYKAIIVDEGGNQEGAQEFMCHSNLDLNPAAYTRGLGVPPPSNTSRLFTISQGQQSLTFPRGFGVPVFSTERLSLTTQVLNLNYDNPHLKLRHKVTVDYAEDTPSGEPMKALFQTAAYGLKSISGVSAIFGADPHASMEHGPSCLPGESAKTSSDITDLFGKQFSGHWVVKPGREVNHTAVTKLLNIRYDTTIHYILVHLHPFAESLELVDLTAKKSLYKSTAKNFKDRIGLERVAEFSSEKGIPVYKDHEYELISDYNNTTDQDQDAMAVMYIFLHDKQFDIETARKQLASLRSSTYAPQTAAPPGPGADLAQSQTAVAAQWAAPGPETKFDTMPMDQLKTFSARVETSLGDFTVELFAETAPNHVRNFLRLASLGVYDGTAFHYLAPGYLAVGGYVGSRSSPLSAEQRAAIAPLPRELGSKKHVRGALSMIRDGEGPDTATTSFAVLFNAAPHLDGQFTVFGRLERGLDVLDKMQKVFCGAGSDRNKPEVPITINRITPVQSGASAAAPRR